MKAAAILILASLAAAAGSVYSHGGLGAGLLAAISNEPTAILLSGSLLLGLAGALRRLDF